MSRHTIIKLILLALLSQSVTAQDEVAAEGIPELDVVESEDLNQLLNDAEKNPPVTTAEELPASGSGDSALSEDLANLESTDKADESLSTAVQTADQELPEPLPQSSGDDLEELKTDLRDTDLSENKVATPEFTPAPSNESSESQAPSLTGPKPPVPVVNEPSFQIRKAVDELDSWQELMVVEYVPGRLQEDFRSAWMNFFRPLQKQCVLGNNRLFLSSNLESLNFYWNLLNVKLTKRLKKTPEGMIGPLNAIQNRWNQVMRTSFGQ